MRPVSSLADEPFAECDGELCLGLDPLARRPFPFLGRVIEHQIQQLHCRLVTGDVAARLVAIEAASIVTAFYCHMPNAEELGVDIFGSRDHPARNSA